MLVYRERIEREKPLRLLAAVRDRLNGLAPTQAGGHDRTVRLLIDLGVLEAALADALHPDADALDPVTGALRAAGVAAGHLLWHSWRGEGKTMGRWQARADEALGVVERAALPDLVETSVPEGYAYYGLYPETYLAAAARSWRALHMPRAVCIGIRSIGTSLSAAVSGALEELGCEVFSLTIRPRGHPFDRRPRFAGELEAALRARAPDVFLIVDEGPGLSGSSLAGTARALEELGVGADRIVLVPSWRTDGRDLRSAEARDRWRRHPQFTATFEEVWRESGRLDAIAHGRTLCDLSAGAWRPVLMGHELEYPAVHPQHERRKLLARAPAPERHEPDLLLRFAGLGAAGEGKLERARALADARFGSAPVTLVHGFLIQVFDPGVPVGTGSPPDELLDAMARYLAWVRIRYPAPEAAPSDLRTMTETNVTEGLGERSAAALARCLETVGTPAEAPTRLDGRMLPHEWLRTPAGFRKADAVDHHDDHFYPGPQDIAWDVAGTCLELGLEGDARCGFVERYRRTSGDARIAARLPFHALAYLAFRLGYATLASQSLGGAPDGVRFHEQAARYRRLLRSELAPGGMARWRT